MALSFSLKARHAFLFSSHILDILYQHVRHVELKFCLQRAFNDFSDAKHSAVSKHSAISKHNDIRLWYEREGG
ncbi:hypothetical protein [Vibrio vulnificus YJ016]|uniref:Uncharacterized protein n=1 Tax=Vibrio vulnificus (strain YJ016) TaxID=196600 RepID=Q7MCS2_VIBVY|nr:hypothetical protein [Vibrio vulnificus YJ016]